MKVCHSGAIGDLIYAIPYIRTLGQQIDLYIGEHNFVKGIPDEFTSSEQYEMLGEIYPESKTLKANNTGYSNYSLLKRLLLEQDDIIKSVNPLIDKNIIDVDLDQFRNSWNPMIHISDIYFQHYKCSGQWKGKPFLFNIPNNDEFRGVICCTRSGRYTAKNGIEKWKLQLQKFKNRKMIFLGIESEYEYFRENIMDIEYIKTNDIYDVAVIINSCDFGIFNATGNLSISIGLNKNRLIETVGQIVDFSVITRDIKETLF